MADSRLDDTIEKAFEQQIKDLRAQITQISKSLSDNGFDIDSVKGDAQDRLHGAAKTAQRAVRHAQDEASAVVDVAKKAPAATGTVLSLTGAIGFGLGYLFCLSQLDQRKRFW